MANTEIESVAARMAEHEAAINALNDQLCEQRAYVHALEALMLQFIAERGIDEAAVRASLGAILHDAPKTGAAAEQRANYLINFRRIRRSAAVVAKRRRRRTPADAS